MNRDRGFIDAQPGFPNVPFENHMRIHLGGKRLEFYDFDRAHTNGSIVVYFPAARPLAPRTFSCSATRHPS